ncbi:hypothetical protein [Mycoplasma hafezii]|uniref:hypothetical protein n=1 Tax=Mycoplasma hafezii TaxID=525886 RepID=UPI003CF6B82E
MKVRDIKTAKDLDKILFLTNPDEYENFQLAGFEYWDEYGMLIVYFKNNAYSFLTSDGYSSIMIEGFQKIKPKKVQNEIIKENYNAPNQIGFYYQNENKYISGNGTFLNYLKPKTGYPTKWFLFTAGHLFFDKFDDKLFQMNLFTTENDTKVNVRVIQDGRNHIKRDISALSSLLPEKYRNLKLNSYLDYAILEINFENEEIAKKFTSIDESDSLFSKSSLRNEIGYFDFQKNDTITFKSFENQAHHTIPFIDSNELIDLVSLYQPNIFVPFLENNKVFEIDNQYYIDLSPLVMFSNSNFSHGSSGMVVSNEDKPFIKTSNSNNDGLWLPLKTDLSLPDALYHVYNEQIDIENKFEVLRELYYDIYFDIENNFVKQNKSFMSTFKKLYPNENLGFDVQNSYKLKTKE